MFDKIRFTYPIAFVLVLSLQACGGSNSGSDDSVTTPISTPVTPDPTPTPNPDEDPIQIFGPQSYVRIANGQSGLTAEIENGDRFARDHDRAGDINGDGVIDLIIGARSDDDSAIDAGAAYILFMNADGSVSSNQKISALDGGFSGVLNEGSFFGYGVAGIGDYDQDGIPDVAVSAPGNIVPTIYILHLNADGTVKSMVTNTDVVALGLSVIGDLNQDGRVDLAAANPNDNNGGSVSLLFFDEDSSINSGDTVTIGENLSGFGTGINPDDNFGGRESALLGDLDNDGTLELAVGAFQSDDGSGAIWILSLDAETFNVVDKLKIGPGLAGFDESIPSTVNQNGTLGGHFGHAMVAAGDLNGDGVPDLITGANQYNNGVGYILYLNADKTVKTYTRIDENEGGFSIPLASEERFSRSVSIVNDAREDGSFSLNMGGGATGEGTVYTLVFQACTITPQTQNTFWDEGNTLFSNWDHASQTVTGPLTFEQCALKAFENDAPNMTAKALDGRCIIKDSLATLQNSDEESQAYTAVCP